jgi:hypothetical protein
MKKYLFALLLIPALCFAGPFSNYYRSMTTEPCGSGSGTNIVGSETHDTPDSMSDGDIRCSLATAIDTCTIDELEAWTPVNQVSGEYVTAGIYTISGTTLTKVQDSGAVDGDSTADNETFTLDSTVNITNGVDYVLCVGIKGGTMSFESDNTAAGSAKSFNSESWSSGTLPATITGYESVASGWQYPIWGNVQ